jgi:type IV pilus assembly protein PilV
MTGQRGFTLLEVLITMAILAFGMLGLATLQVKMNLAHVDSFQRAQAVVLMQDMADRINTNRANATSYVTASGPLGTGDSQPTSCTGSPGVTRDKCEWSNALKGAAEAKSGTNVGAMIGARGCVEQIQAANPAPTSCTPAIYRVTVVWQGLTGTSQSQLTCGANLYGSSAGVDDTYRRAISEQITIGLPGCG